MSLLNLDQDASFCAEPGDRLNEALTQGRFSRTVPHQNREGHLESVQECGLITASLMGSEGKRTLSIPDSAGGIDGLRRRQLPLRHGSDCTRGIRTLFDTHGPFQLGVTTVTLTVKKRLGVS